VAVLGRVGSVVTLAALLVLARLGSVVTLAALLVLAATAASLADGAPAGSAPTMTVTDER
jgi:hypothetical protein